MMTNVWHFLAIFHYPLVTNTPSEFFIDSDGTVMNLDSFVASNANIKTEVIAANKFSRDYLLNNKDFSQTIPNLMIRVTPNTFSTRPTSVEETSVTEYIRQYVLSE